MNYKHILKVSLAALASLAVLAGCAKKEFQEVTELSLKRCLEPQNLSARVDVATGDNVTFGWDVNKDADGYLLTVYTDEEMTEFEDSWDLEPNEVPFTTRLTADQKYWFNLRAYRVDKEGNPIESTFSNLAVYDGSIKTYAVKDNLYLEVTGRTETSVSLAWSNEVSDYEEVTDLRAVPVKGGETVKKELSAAEKTAAAATIEGLEPATEYQITLFYMSASRGARDTWTKAEQGTAALISDEASLKTAVVDGGEYYLAYSDTPYSMSTAKPKASLSLIGELGPDGEKPVVVGKIELTADLAEEGANLHFGNIKFDGAAGSRIVEHTGGSPVVGTIDFTNCEITNYTAGFFYGNNDAVVKIDKFSFDSCDMYGIVGSGGDAVDIRKTTEIGEIAFVNNTLYDGIRTLFRIDASDAIKIGKITFENNTVKNIATIDDGNNRGLFAIRVATEMSLKNNLFLWEDGGKDDSTTDADKAQLFQDNANTVVPTLNASGNYSYANGKSFFNKVSAAEAGFKVMNVDPCYNSKGNFFQLAAQDLIEGQVGASKWWISYVEKPEDLTQEAITEAHTWNLQDASLFAGEVKNSRVRDGLLLVGTEATPMNADGAISFLSASVLNRKGLPTEGYAAFKVNAPGSVDILLTDPNKAGGSVVIALYDDNGLAVQGGAAVSSNGVQKILVPEVSGEGTIYIYALGAVSMTKLAWSEDTEGGNKVLATPKPVVEPVTLTEGDETELNVTWEAIDNAASYVVVFNKRRQDPQTELSFTVPAEDIAALKAGLYNVTVQALPREGDIYYVASDQGSASFAVQPLSSEGGEVVEETWTWDFSSSDWQDVLSPYGNAGTDLPNWNVTVDGLTWISTANSRWNTTYIQSGNAGSTADRYFKFTAPYPGTLKVWTSNTGSSEAPTRGVTVNVGGVEEFKAGGSSSNAAPTENEFEISEAGEVYIYATGGGLRFYKIEFHYSYTTGGSTPVEYDWDFSSSDWQDVLSPYGNAGTDLPNWNVTVDGLTWISTANSRWNTTYIQSGNAGSTADRYFKFTAPDPGIVKVWTSNTGSSEAPTRGVTVNVGGVEEFKAGGSSSNAAPTENEFEISEAGEVYIYATGGGLRFYRIYYTNQK